MGIFEALVLGLVQGLTEFIPVSSSGHLLLTHRIFGSTENSLGFDVALHVGTLIALLVYFRKDIWQLITNIFSKNRDGRLARLLIYATIPAATAGFLFSDFIDEKTRSPFVVAVTLSSVALVMLYAEKVSEKNKNQEDVSNKQGMIIGTAQIAALVPGVSRSGATITTGILLGLKKEQAARFSFLLAIPIIAGSALGVLAKGEMGKESLSTLIVGVTAAFASGLFAVSFMLRSISKLGLKPFVIYRILLALVVIIFLV